VATVWVVQDSGRLDLSDASRYGALRTIFTGELFPDNADERAAKAMEHAYHTLRQFQPEIDYLCLVGSPLYTAMCAYVLGDLAMAPLRLLRFDRIEQRYYEVSLR
jgi:hypothetical protein